MLLAAFAMTALTQPVVIPSHDHSAGPVPRRITQSAEIDCAAGRLTVRVSQFLSGQGVRLDRVTVDEQALSSGSIAPVAERVHSLDGLSHVEVGCFDRSNAIARVIGVRTSTGAASVAFLVGAMGIRLLP